MRYLSKINNILNQIKLNKIKNFIKNTEAEKNRYKNLMNSYGIDLKTITENKIKDYYKILNISYTDNKEEIRYAYINLMKMYHPDINKSVDAETKTKEINEAYITLKEKTSKINYDSNYKKGNTLQLNKTNVNSISKTLIKNYYKLREQDIEIFNTQIQSATTKNEVNAIIINFVDWQKRFENAKTESFLDIFKYEKKFKKLYFKGAKLLKDKNIDKDTYQKINDITQQLEVLEKNSKEINKAIIFVADNIKQQISKEEEKIKDRLYSSI
ncbi:MAG: DnaJ domain-containing protein [Candidatus Marsarchaeota archaeon]|nr:DnaJ domain-containing protein [Candidatus Marsarchaeota archaeon]